MRTLRFLVAGLLACVSGIALADENRQSFDLIERGRYLATVGDCVACHSAPNKKPFAGGLAIETPFGVLVSPNITPDAETGIGKWNDDEFVRAMREGIGRHGEYLYPAFPYPNFTKATRDDVLAIKAYLNTLDPVDNAVETNRLPFPFNIRTSLLVWNALNFKPGEFQPQADRSAEWNRGAYLVEGLAHCGACHTPKTLTGGDKTDLTYQGAVIQNWFAPALTNDPRTGLGKWDVQDVVSYLKTGHNKYAAASGPMAEVVVNSTSKLEEADLAAIAVYLKDVPGTPPAATTVSSQDADFMAGRQFYHDQCAACHRLDGSGVPNLFPSLAGAASVQSNDATSLIRVTLQGVRSVATPKAPTGPGMPSFSWKYSDRQISQILTYIRNDWDNKGRAITADEVASLRKTLAREGQ